MRIRHGLATWMCLCSAYVVVSYWPLFLKVPKCEIFDLLSFTLINPIWSGDLGTGLKKFCILYFVPKTFTHAECTQKYFLCMLRKRLKKCLCIHELKHLNFLLSQCKNNFQKLKNVWMLLIMHLEIFCAWWVCANKISCVHVQPAIKNYNFSKVLKTNNKI